ncbi:hypothetical protein ACHAXS_006063 [Conticribra weissflogii]
MEHQLERTSNYTKVIHDYNYKPTPTKYNSNYSRYSLQKQPSTIEDNNNITVQTSNTTTSQKENNTHLANKTATKLVNNDHGISDAGATSTFLIPGAPVKNLTKATTPLAIQLPDGNTIYSTHTCSLDIDWLPEEATEAHIVPDLAHTSLISIRQLCDNGCTVIYNNEACKVFYKEKLVWKGSREPKTGLWELPLNPQHPSQPTTTTTSNHNKQHYANNAYTITTKADLIKYLHQCAFSPTISTWIKAINNNQFPTWPGLTAAAVQRHLPESPATDKGHLKQLRQNIRSTKPQRNENNDKQTQDIRDISEEDNMSPAREEFKEDNKTNIFCFAAIADVITGTIYSNNIGQFPIRSLEGALYFFLLIKCNFDNIVSKPVQKFLESKNINIQIVEPHNHRVNAAKRTIQTFKDHFIAGLCTTDKQFPIQPWDQLLEQGQDTLNMLRTSHIHPHLSAYTTLKESMISIARH